MPHQPVRGTVVILAGLSIGTVAMGGMVLVGRGQEWSEYEIAEEPQRRALEDVPPGWFVFAVLAAAVGIVAVLVLWALLRHGALWLAGEKSDLTSVERAELTVAERVEAVNQARHALMQAVTGLVVVGGVIFTGASLVYTSKTLKTTQQGQVTDRYTKAIEQLGDSKPEVRLGGIYALQRLMVDSPRDRQTILEVLAAYVRTHAQDPPTTGTDKTRLAVDTEAALTIAINSRNDKILDLSNVDFHGRNVRVLQDADLSGANLRGANLRSAHLCRANLTDWMR